ncbi:MAG TPA: hypothetical protein VIX18_04630, partial [Nitrospirota bacterium]
KGIKFACTKCGEMVKITREEFDAYIQAQTSVSEPAVLETPPVPAPPAPPEPGKGSAPTEPVAGPGEEAPAHAPVPDVRLNIPAPPIEEPTPVKVEPKPAPPRMEPRVVSEPQPAVARPVAHHPEPAAALTRREYSHYAPRAAERTARSRSRSLLPLVLIVLVMAGIAGYGIYLYTGTASQNSQKTKTTEEKPRPASSTEGLQIVSATGAMDPSGDLLINSVIENSLSVERTAWYVVVDILGTQGALLSRIRVVNGKQLFTQRDYDIMASRGVNVQELKAKNLEDQGMVVPPHESVSFEIRYIKPQGGIGSFNATVQPYDPARMFKEISGEIK